MANVLHIICPVYRTEADCFFQNLSAIRSHIIVLIGKGLICKQKRLFHIIHLLCD